jgi:hypothetical protein
MPPIFRWMANRCPEGEPVDVFYVCTTLGLVLAAGFMTDMIGIHALFGAFVIGVLVPHEGPFAGALVEKVEDLVSGLFLPLYFVSSGLKTNVATIHGAQSWGLLVLVIVTACVGKILGTVAVAVWCKMPFKEALALGILMNTKGFVELIVLNIRKDRGVLSDQTFAIMVLMALFTTFMTTPLVIAVYKPAKKLAKSEYKHRTIQRQEGTKSQLRTLICFHSSRNIPTMINLMEASRGTGIKEGLCVYAMHLMELSERSSAILMVHKARRNGLPFWNKLGTRTSGSNQIVVAFEAFEHLSKVSIRPTTAISPVSSMHEDICGSAESKRVAMIIIPFHKHLRIDGQLETTRLEFRNVNRCVLERAPCSVGILVDRGLGGSSHISASNVDSVTTVLFFGGHDDHEALAYGQRMAEHPGIHLVVVRFILDTSRTGDQNEGTVTVDMNDFNNAEARAVDDEVINELKTNISTNSTIKYEERIVGRGEETRNAIREYSRCNLFLVGRAPEGELVASLKTNKEECQELGAIGNLLISAEFSTQASVLVIQQYHSQLSLHSLSSITEDGQRKSSDEAEDDYDSN